MYVWPETGCESANPNACGDLAVERLDLGVVAVEQGQEAGLGAGRPLHAEEPEVGQAALDVGQVEDQLIAQSVARLPTVTSWAGWKWV